MSTCKRLSRNIFIQNLNLSEIEVNSINFVLCHKIGMTTLPNGTVNRKCPIIVCCHSYNDRKVVWSALKNESILINNNFFTDEVEYRRRPLYPILKAAKQSSRFERKAFINPFATRSGSGVLAVRRETAHSRFLMFSDKQTIYTSYHPMRILKNIGNCQVNIDS